MTRTTFRGLVLAVTASATVVTRPIAAQAVEGQVIDSTSGAPVGIGFVVLLDEAGNEIARTLSGADGRFSLRAPQDGIYRLRSERIGYRASVSPPITIPVAGTVEYTLYVSAFPVRLATVEVQGRDRCHINPAQSEATVTVWEEVRKALAAAAWGDAQDLYLYRKYAYERDLNASRRTVARERGRRTDQVSSPPFRSLDAAMLVRDGFIVERGNGRWYYAPDAHTLLDDAFLNTHCFHVVREARDRPGLVGLAFEPVPGRNLPDVEGTLWLDETTSELRQLDVQYTRLPENLRDGRVGATVHFLMLPSGAWIVRRWQIRTPMIEVLAHRSGLRESWTDGFRDIGGEILEVATRGREVIYTATVAHVSGVIFDSTTAAPLRGAAVSIPGTELWTTSWDDGSFSLGAPLEGVYSLQVAHPRLDSLGIRQPLLRVNLSRGDTTQVPIAIPHVDGVLDRRCPRWTDRPERRALIGTVFERDGRSPVGNARVEASWQDLSTDDRGILIRDRQQTTTADSAGRYLLCDLPRGRPVHVRAVHRRVWSELATVVFPEGDRGTLLLARDRHPGQSYDEAHETSYRIWQVDLALAADEEPGRADEAPPTLMGIVADDSTERGIENAIVVLNDRDTAVTRADGSFDITGVRWEPGANILSVTRAGYRTLSRQLWIDLDRRELAVRIGLQPETPAHAPPEAQAPDSPSPGLEGFFQRRRRGRGRFVTATEIEQMEASDLTEVLRRIPSVTLLRAAAAAGSAEYIRFSSASAPCRAGQQQPLVYLDGAAAGVDQLLTTPTADVAGLELYDGPGDVPPQFNAWGADCGVIVVWTK